MLLKFYQRKQIKNALVSRVLQSISHVYQMTPNDAKWRFLATFKLRSFTKKGKPCRNTRKFSKSVKNTRKISCYFTLRWSRASNPPFIFLFFGQIHGLRKAKKNPPENVAEQFWPFSREYRSMMVVELSPFRAMHRDFTLYDGENVWIEILLELKSFDRCDAHDIQTPNVAVPVLARWLLHKFSLPAGRPNNLQ